MNLNRSFKDFKFRHRSNKNQIIYTAKKIKDDEEILNLIDNFLSEKNSFIFESVEKGKIKGRYTIFGKNPDKIWEFKNKISYLIQNETITNNDKMSEYASKQNSNLKNNMLKSYDLYLNSRYDVTLNQKTIERVKNFFQ